MGHAAFERLLIERAKPESLQTDRAGAWFQVYQHVLTARALDRGLYERALLNLQPFRCETGTDEAARLSCAANAAADVASGMTTFAAAVEFRRDAVTFAERVSIKSPAPLFDVLIALASDEQKHGSYGEAARAVDRAADVLIAHPRLGDAKRRFQMAILRAKLADARLDDVAASEALGEAVDIAIRSRARKTSTSEAEAIATEPLDDLIRLHLRGRFCPSCGSPILEAAKIWIAAMLTGRAAVNTGTEYSQHEHLLMALSAPAGAFPPAQMKAFADRFLKLSRNSGGEVHPDVGRFVASSTDRQEVVRYLALSSSLIGSMGITGDEFPKAFSALRANDERRRNTLLREALQAQIQMIEENGGNSDVAPTLDRIARELQAAGLRAQARTTLRLMMERGAKWAAGAFLAEKNKLAAVYAPALARLASLDFAAGDRGAALRSLDEASTLAGVKLRAEWAEGGTGSIQAMRDLAPTLRLIAQKRAEIVLPTGAGDPPEREALFRELQGAMFGETALAVEVAARRRVLADAASRDLSRDYQQARGQAVRAAEIASYALEGGDVGGARAAARRDAEARRDALAGALRLKAPAGSATIADVDPVPLAEARARLRTGEALVLLHAGSHAVHGFLLGADGRTQAWRSPVRLSAVEAAVRTIRAGGDVLRAAKNPFPVDEAARLHETLFGPVRDRLGAYTKLLIVGDGPLQAMPYGLLLTRPVTAPATPEAHRTAALPWLVRSHAVALLPSVRTLLAQRSGTLASRAEKPFLGVGDPQLAKGEGALRAIEIPAAFAARTGYADVDFLRRLVSLPETADELRAIAALLKAPPETLMLGAAATERAVRAAPLTDYRIVAFATHGALAGEITGTAEPGLVLTPPAKASRDDDGFLALSEIMGLRLDADLVMLSACNTAASDGRSRAEGLSGLARGFFGAGARSLLVTHWAIPSEASVKITTGLIGHQRGHPGTDWAEALRAATLAMIDGEGPPEWAHPAYWAGFATVGVLPAPP